MSVLRNLDVARLYVDAGRAVLAGLTARLAELVDPNPSADGPRVSAALLAAAPDDDVVDAIAAALRAWRDRPGNAGLLDIECVELGYLLAAALSDQLRRRPGTRINPGAPSP